MSLLAELASYAATAVPNESTMERAGLFLLLAGSNLFLLKIVDALVRPAIVYSSAPTIELPTD